MIPVTRPYLPSRERLDKYIDRIYESAWLTNRGPLLQELESRLSEFLDVQHVILVANGSLALQLAYKALELTGEVITTPFTFLATSSTLVWEGLTPVFADISPESLNLDPKKIEALISKKTSAIVPVHVYGNPCDVEAIQSLADKHGLKVIYDAAHAFGVRFKGRSILKYGDVSILSFHATKIFHTIEGGAVVTNDPKIAERLRQLINFGLSGPETIERAGTNAKMNEFEAAMGMAVLDEMETVISQRASVWEEYINNLPSGLELPRWAEGATRNHSYFPVLFKDEAQLLHSRKLLESSGYVTRRYFYPSLDGVGALSQQEVSCPVSRDVAKRVLCLPIFPGLTRADIKGLIEILKESLNATPWI
jgi:dTDP-4-amino-4,6-dideoxygalactose transaminase